MGTTKKYGFTVKQNKGKFIALKLEFLSFRINRDGLHIAEAEVKAIIVKPVSSKVSKVSTLTAKK